MVCVFVVCVCACVKAVRVVCDVLWCCVCFWCVLRLCVCFNVVVYVVCVLLCDGVWSAVDACFVCVCSCVLFNKCLCILRDVLCGVVVFVVMICLIVCVFVQK